MKHFELNQTYCKVLLTISELNKQGYYPLNEGVYKIVAGLLDEEVEQFSHLITFATLTSFSSKKICHLTLMLFKHGLIGKIFDPSTKKLYLRITDNGEQSLVAFFSKHKKSFAKRAPKKTPSIVKIDG